MATGTDIVPLVKGWLKSQELETGVTSVLPEHLSYKHLARTALHTFESKPEAWQGCNVRSIVECIMTCAEVGAPIGRNQAYLIPRRTNNKLMCTVVFDYRFLITLAAQAGIRVYTPQVVYEGEDCEYEGGTSPFIRHTPSPDANHDKPVAFYAVSENAQGHKNFAWLWNWEVERIRNRVKDWERGAWGTDHVGMGRKSAVRKLLNITPSRADRPAMAQAVRLEEQAYAGVRQTHSPLDVDLATTLHLPDAELPDESAADDAADATAESDAALRQVQERQQKKFDAACEAAKTHGVDPGFPVVIPDGHGHATAQKPVQPAEAPDRNAAAERDAKRREAGTPPLQKPNELIPGAMQPASAEPPDKGGTR